VRQIVPNPLSGEAWAPFGWLPLADTDPEDGRHTLAFEWADAHVNRIAHRRDEVPAVGGGLRCQVLYRHRTHTQVLTPLDATSVVAVAPPGVDLVADGTDQVRAFVLRPLESVVLHRGTWHWGPFPTAADAVELLNVQGRRYREDNDSVDLAAVGAAFDVLVPG
jgi:ureidoglycolate hydrolase